MEVAGMASSALHETEYFGRSPSDPRVLDKFIKANEKLKFSGKGNYSDSAKQKQKEFAKSTGIGRHIDLKV